MMVAVKASFLLSLFQLSSFSHGFVVPTSPSTRTSTEAALFQSSSLQTSLHAKESGNEDNKPSLTSSSRRQFLSAGILASSLPLLVPQTANADPSALSSLQGPIQDTIAPGHWIGQFAGLNSATATWRFTGDKKYSAERVSKALVEVIEGLSTETRAELKIPELTITKADATNVHVMTWTFKEWLDSLDVSFVESTGGGDSATTTTTAKATFYATGLFPTSVPGAPILNILFAWFPFGSPGPTVQNPRLQEFRLKRLEQLVRAKLSESDQVDRIATMI